jgi:hypothetical protein
VEAAEEGVVPRALRQVLDAAAAAGEGCRVRISIFEIYNEKLRDLLVFSSSAAAGAAAGGGGPLKKNNAPPRSSFGGGGGGGSRSSFLFGGSNGSGRASSFAPNVDRGGGVGARDSRDLPIREDQRGNIVVPGLNEVEVTVRVFFLNVCVGFARGDEIEVVVENKGKRLQCLG